MRALLLLMLVATAAGAWFEPNHGQFGKNVVFAGGGAAFGRSSVSWQGMRMSFPAAVPEGEAPLPGRRHYLGRARELRDVPAFAALRYRNVYPGVDLRFYLAAAGLEYDLILAPGADLRQVRLRFSGDVPRLPAFARQGGRRVTVRYRARGGAVGFECLDCDASQPLTVDPLLVYATYSGGAATEAATAVAVDGAGNSYIASGNTVTKYDAAGANILLRTSVGPEGSIIRGLALDADGGIVVAGTAAPGLTPTEGAYRTANPSGFVARIVPAGDRLTFASVFAGQPAALALDASGNAVVTGTSGNDVLLLKLSRDGSRAIINATFGGSAVDAGRAVAVNAAGEIHVAGYTASPDFPTTATSTERGGDAFVTKFDAAGARIYSILLGGAAADSAQAIAADAAGVVVAGSTESADFPGATASRAGGLDGWIARLTPSGALTWSRRLAGSADDSVLAVAIDAAGRAVAAGNSDSADFPTTAQSLPSCRRGGPFLARFDPDGALLDSTHLSGIGFDAATALAVNDRDAAYVAGSAASRVFFSTPGAAQTRFGGGDSDAFAAKIDLSRPPGTMIACVLNGASFQAGNTTFFPLGTIAPGEIVSLFGTGLGPEAPAGTRLAAEGTVATELEGTRVLFDGIAAPLLYVSATQVNAVVPFGLNAAEAKVTLERGGASAGPVALPVADAVPAIFTYDGSGRGQALVVNEDGSLNSLSNPAARGSIVTFYATGFGRMAPTMTDGAVAPLSLPLPAPSLQVAATVRGSPAEVVYAGAMPGAVAGAIQVNVRVPTAINFGNSVPLIATVGGISSQLQITLAVK